MISEMWWDESHDWSIATGGYKLFRRYVETCGTQGGDHDTVFDSWRSEEGVSRTATLAHWRADFDLFRRLVEKVPYESILKGKGVQEG